MMNKQPDKAIRVAVVEDHKVVREGLVSMLRKEPKVSVVMEAANGKEFLDKLHETPVDVALIDLEMPVLNGRQTLLRLKKESPNVKSIMLSMYGDENIVIEMLKDGACGYIPKNCSYEDVVDAIFDVQFKGHHSSYLVSQSFFNQLHRPFSPGSHQAQFLLSERDTRVLQMLCDGKLSVEIADKMACSKKLIDAIRSKLLDTLEANNTASLVRKSILLGLYSPKTDEQIISQDKEEEMERERRRKERLAGGNTGISTIPKPF